MHQIRRVLVILSKEKKKADKNTYELIIAQCFPFAYFNAKKYIENPKYFKKKGCNFYNIVI